MSLKNSFWAFPSDHATESSVSLRDTIPSSLMDTNVASLPAVLVYHSAVPSSSYSTRFPSVCILSLYGAVPLPAVSDFQRVSLGFFERRMLPLDRRQKENTPFFDMMHVLSLLPTDTSFCPLPSFAGGNTGGAGGSDCRSSSCLSKMHTSSIDGCALSVSPPHVDPVAKCRQLNPSARTSEFVQHFASFFEPSAHCPYQCFCSTTDAFVASLK
mmetsp:Transcript_42830/g.101909  ORF Transcript_42830/g.101909 Transcript_42830/m.101909 type:complete len:213 (+) Transcript_42830:1249-1887(+)